MRAVPVATDAVVKLVEESFEGVSTPSAQPATNDQRNQTGMPTQPAGTPTHVAASGVVFPATVHQELGSRTSEGFRIPGESVTAVRAPVREGVPRMDAAPTVPTLSASNATTLEIRRSRIWKVS